VKASQASNLPVTRRAIAESRVVHQRVGLRERSTDRRSQPTAITDEIEENTAMDWRHRALCRDEDPELFFPIGTTGPAVVQIEQAKAVCRRCPVMQSCLEWALSSGQDSGVWGGLSEDERRALKRRTARTRVHTA
jgi:WhiB family redox-sensing transcriptional regulator